MATDSYAAARLSSVRSRSSIRRRSAFEDLPVWQTAADLAARMLEWIQQPELRGKGDLANQLQHAALSISNNIAEGLERSSTSELLHFLYIARGSAGEVRSMLCVMERMSAFDNLKSDISNFKSTCENISRQIRGWADSLQNSDIKGVRCVRPAPWGREIHVGVLRNHTKQTARAPPLAGGSSQVSRPGTEQWPR